MNNELLFRDTQFTDSVHIDHRLVEIIQLSDLIFSKSHES